jgi:hypothetical protein
MSEEMVIFARTFDLLTWILPHTERFPRMYRSTVTLRLCNALLDFQEALYEAQSEPGPRRLGHLRRADAHLDKVRLYLRLAHQFQWLKVGQYEHVSRMLEEVGRLLGGWFKASL